MLNAPNMPAPKPQRSKQAINELLDESGKILDIVKKNIPILEEWRKLLNQNPESVCLGSDQEALKGQIKSLTDKIRESGEEVGNVLEQNSIDRAELTLLLRNTRMPMLFGFAAATNTLFAYRGDISRIEGHPSCDAIVRANQIPTAYANMLTGFLQFSSWLGETQEKLSNYRDDLRKELRNAP
jgi:hypothetical protein